MSRHELILGGPGCGKTTRLLEIMEQCLRDEIPSERIAFISFTRAAVGEAKERAMTQFDLSARSLPFFRTLHSLAFFLLGIESNELMNDDDYAAIGKALGLKFDGVDETEREARNGDRLLFVDAIARARGRALREEYNTGAHDVPWPILQHAIASINKYKQDMGLYDYQDLIDVCREQLDVDVAIIDEAQDLTTAQWRMVDSVLSNVPRVVYAGDDDQAIYQWTGADVERFLHLDAARETLPQSHRLPERIWSVANEQAHRIGQRYEKQWTFRSDGGTIAYLPGLNAIDWTREGSWLILARNRYLLTRIRRSLRAAGILYTGAVDPAHVAAIQGWEKYRTGRELTEVQENAMLKHAPAKLPGKDTPWMEALTGIAGTDRAYYRAIKRRGGRVTDEPSVQLSTIHQIKGAEADHVVLLSDMASRTYKNYMNAPNAEHRVWYVAITRARQSLTVLQPQSTQAYQFNFNYFR